MIDKWSNRRLLFEGDGDFSCEKLSKGGLKGAKKYAIIKRSRRNLRLGRALLAGEKEQLMKKICYVTTVSLTVKAFILETAKYLAANTDWEITIICDGDE